MSTPFTTFLRLVWPALPLLAGFVLVVVGTYGAERAPTWLLVVISLAAVITSASSYYRKLRLRKVAIDGERLYVWTHSRQESIPLDEVASVEFDSSPFRSQVVKPYRVFIRVGRSPATPREIEFVPGFYVRDVVRELKEAVERARRENRH